MTSISKNMYINNFDNMVNEYNNTYHSTIKLKPVNVKLSTYINFGVENNDGDTKFEVGNRVRISKDKNVLAKCYALSLSEGVLWLKKLKIICCGLKIQGLELKR